MGLPWAILQGIKNDNQMLRSMQVLDGEETNLGGLWQYFLRACTMFLPAVSLWRIYTGDSISFQINVKYTTRNSDSFPQTL